MYSDEDDAKIHELRIYNIEPRAYAKKHMLVKVESLLNCFAREITFLKLSSTPGTRLVLLNYINQASQSRLLFVIFRTRLFDVIVSLLKLNCKLDTVNNFEILLYDSV